MDSKHVTTQTSATSQLPVVGPYNPVFQGHGSTIVYPHMMGARVIFAGFDGKKSKKLGIIKLVFAFMSVAFVAVGIPMERRLYDTCYSCGTAMFIIGFGYWCPVFFIISGSIGVAAAKQKSASMIKALLGMSILSVLASFALVASSIVAVVNLTDLYYTNRYSNISVAMAVLLLVCGMFEVGASIWMSKLCGDQLSGKTPPLFNSPQSVQIFNTGINAMPYNMMNTPQHQFSIPRPYMHGGQVNSATNPQAMLPISYNALIFQQSTDQLPTHAMAYPQPVQGGNVNDVVYHVYPQLMQQTQGQKGAYQTLRVP